MRPKGLNRIIVAFHALVDVGALASELDGVLDCLVTQLDELIGALQRSPVDLIYDCLREVFENHVAVTSFLYLRWAQYAWLRTTSGPSFQYIETSPETMSSMARCQ